MGRIDFSEKLKRQIAATGPISVAHYMGQANAHYYATRDPLGAAGDFTTAPEISQMFGELVGLWLADLWIRAGRPDGACYVELGPGRGTLAADALRAMKAAGLTPPVHLVETSPVLRAAQKERVPDARWHDDVDTLPEDRPLLIVANEFFDALPVRQLARMPGGWCERMVGIDDGAFMPGAGPLVPDNLIPPHLRHAPVGSVLETSPASVAIMRALSERIAGQGGAALIIDYGHERTSIGDTLQAVRGHAYADPFANPGEHDLTVHVDFEALGDAARAGGARVSPVAAQGAFLTAMSIDLRAAALSRAAPARAGEIETARSRLVAPEQMGTLFKAMALTAPAWPEPLGF
ncbi:class I SAM-dependent methyltransferase [Allosphingosinicella vermicomposti]|uniref:class I SAM-dependent methyltransferase n=1 Tax=Allosphingosinicella vermicomposti TaxID=614671 RepID=UPI001FDF5E26|nr:SAM-dependent methyltransferase [Allosphingosinicella vermicomposti]